MSDRPPRPSQPTRASTRPRHSLVDWQDEEPSTRTTETTISTALPLATKQTARAILTVISGASAGRVHSLSDGVTLIGRARDAHLRFDEAGVSRLHARVMVGDGGKYVEVLRDLELLLPPFNVDDVHEALSRLRLAPILKGVRGEPPLDVEPLCQAAVRLGQLMTALNTVASIDIMPAGTGEPGALLDFSVFTFQFPTNRSSAAKTAVEARATARSTPVNLMFILSICR